MKERLKELKNRYSLLGTKYRQLSMIEFNSNSYNLYQKKIREIESQKKNIDIFFNQNFTTNDALFIYENFPYSHAKSIEEIFLAPIFFNENDALYRKFFSVYQKDFQKWLLESIYVRNEEKFAYFEYVYDETFLKVMGLFTAKATNLEYILLKNHLAFTIPNLEYTSYPLILENEKDKIKKANLSYYEYQIFKKDTIQEEMQEFLRICETFSKEQFKKATLTISFSLYFMTMSFLFTSTADVLEMVQKEIKIDYMKTYFLNQLKNKTMMLKKIK